MKTNKKRAIKQHLEFLEVLSFKKKVDDCKVLGKKPRKHTQHEAKEQEALFQWARLQKNVYPELDLLYAVPNAGRRTSIEGHNMVKQGLKAGVPDVCLPVARNGYSSLYIELKVGKNTASDNQKEWIAKLLKFGNKVEVCYGWESAKNTILEYLR